MTDKFAFLDTQPADKFSFLDDKPVEAPVEPKGAFTSTLKSTGAHMLNSFAGQPVEDIGEAVGSEGIQKAGKGIRNYAERVQKDNPSAINSMSDIVEHPIDAVKTAAGNVIPQLPVSLASGWAGAKAGAMLPLPPHGRAVAGIAGGLAGLFAPSYLQEYTEMRGKQHENGQEDIPKALGYAVPAAASDVVMDKVLLGGSKLLPKPLRNAAADTLEQGASRLAHVGKQGAKGFGAEYGQEYGQTYLEQAGGNEDTGTEQAANERNVSAALGGIGGSMIKGGVSAFDARKETPVVDPAVQPPVNELPVEPENTELPDEPETQEEIDNGAARSVPVSESVDGVEVIPTGPEQSFGQPIEAIPQQATGTVVQPVEEVTKSLKEANAGLKPGLFQRATGAAIDAGITAQQVEAINPPVIEEGVDPETGEIIGQREEDVPEDPLVVAEEKKNALAKELKEYDRILSGKQQPGQRPRWVKQREAKELEYLEATEEYEALRKELNGTNENQEDKQIESEEKQIPTAAVGGELVVEPPAGTTSDETGSVLPESTATEPGGVLENDATQDLTTNAAAQPTAHGENPPAADLNAVSEEEKANVNEPVAGSDEAVDLAPVANAANQHTPPTDDQIKEENYPVTGADFHGVHVATETKAGDTRSGVDANGKPWSVVMQDNYGSIPNVQGNDKDHLDVFTPKGLTKEQEAKTKMAFVVDQVDPTTGLFDEHKIMLGYPTIAAARKAYLRNYSPGWKGLGAITAMPIAELKEKVNTVWDKPVSPDLQPANSEQQSAEKPAMSAAYTGNITGDKDLDAFLNGINRKADENGIAVDNLRKFKFDALKEAYPEQVAKAEELAKTAKFKVTRRGKHFLSYLEIPELPSADFGDPAVGSKWKKDEVVWTTALHLIKNPGIDTEVKPTEPAAKGVLKGAPKAKKEVTPKHTVTEGGKKRKVDDIQKQIVHAEEKERTQKVAGEVVGQMKEEAAYNERAKNRQAFTEKYALKGAAFAQSLINNDYEKAVDDLYRGRLPREVATEIFEDAKATGLLNDVVIKKVQAELDTNPEPQTATEEVSKPKWHIDIPEEGLGILPDEANGAGYRTVPGRLAKDAVEAAKSKDDTEIGAAYVDVYEALGKDKPEPHTQTAESKNAPTPNIPPVLQADATGQSATPKAEQADKQTTADVLDKEQPEKAAGKDKGQPVSNADSVSEYPPQAKKEAREWLVAKIDAAILEAPDKVAFADVDDARIQELIEEKKVLAGEFNRMQSTGNPKEAIALGLKIEGLEREQRKIIGEALDKVNGRVTFKIPGGTQFKVRNDKPSLQEFKKKVLASPGFKDTKATKPESRYHNTPAAQVVANFLKDDELENAYYAAKANGVPIGFGNTNKEGAHLIYVGVEPVTLYKDRPMFVGHRYTVSGDSVWHVIDGPTASTVNESGTEKTKASAIASAKKRLDALEKKGLNLDEATGKTQEQLLAEFKKDYGIEDEAEETPPEPPKGGKKQDVKESLQDTLRASEDIKAPIDWIAKNSSDKSYQAIAKRILGLLGDTKLIVVTAGVDVPGGVPTALNIAKGVYFSDGKTGQRKVFLKDESFEENGMNETTILHEAIHAALLDAVEQGRMLKNAYTPLGEATVELFKLQNAVVAELNKRSKEGTLSEYESKLRTNLAASSADELLAHGLTEVEFQDMLKSIKMEGASAWSKFVDTLRKLLGIAKEDSNALSELISVADKLITAAGKTSKNTQASGTLQQLQDIYGNPATFTSEREAAEHLVKAFGPGINTLIRDGILNITRGQDAWPAQARRSSQGRQSRIEGVYVNDKVFIDIDATVKERLQAVALHEIGEHFNLRKMLGTADYEALQNQIANRAKIDGSEAARIWNQVDEIYTNKSLNRKALVKGSKEQDAWLKTKMNHPELVYKSPEFLDAVAEELGQRFLKEGDEAFIAEVIAKLGEVNPNAPWYRRLIARIKAFLMERGLARGFVMGTLTDQDIHALLVASLQSAARSQERGVARFYGPGHPQYDKYNNLNLNAAADMRAEGAMQSAMLDTNSVTSPQWSGGDTITVDGKERSTTNSNGKPIAATEEGLRNFWRWFGESKVVDDQGRPLVVYHGGNGDLTSIDAGMYSSDKLVPSMYAEIRKGAVYPTYLSIQKPAPWELGELNDVRRLEDAGYDGSIKIGISDSGELIPHIMYPISAVQSKSAIGNTGDFSPDSNDIRYSIVDDFLSPSQKEKAEGVKDTLVDWKDTLGEKIKKQSNALLTVLQMEEQNADILPGIADYTEPMHRRRTVIDTVLRNADRIISTWKKLDKKGKELLADTMHTSTLHDVDASRAWSGVTVAEKPSAFGSYIAHSQAKLAERYEKKLMAQAVAISGLTVTSEIASFKTQNTNKMRFQTPEQANQYVALLNQAERDQTAFRANRYKDENLGRRIGHTQVEQAYSTLPDAGKEVYKATHDMHNDLANTKLQILTDRVSEAIYNGEKRQALNAMIRKQFESNKLDFYYAPLLRFGDQWFYGTTKDGKPYFETFNNEKARDRAAKKFNEENGTEVEIGTTLRDLAVKAAAAGDTFITDVIKIVDSKDIDEKQSKELQDEIYQMYLSTLPEVSLRHGSQHRKGTLGFEQDAMRAFAYTMHHGASQIANMKEGREMEQALDEMGEVHKLSQNAKGRQQAGLEIAAAKYLSENFDELSQEGAIDAMLDDEDSDEDEHILKTAKMLLKKFGSQEKSDTLDALDDYVDKLKQRLARAALITDKNKNQAANVISEIGKTYNAMVNTQSSDMDAAAAYLRQFGFIYMLGFGFSSGLFNTMQTPMVAMPVVSAKYGMPDTVKQFKNAYAEFATAVKSAMQKDANGNYTMRDEDGNASISTMLEKKIKGLRVGTPEWDKVNEELNFMADRKADGTISRTQTHDVISVGKEGVEHGGPLFEFTKKAGLLFHHGERLNREVTLLAAFRTAREANKTAKPGADGFEEAANYARKVTNETHLEYSPENAARIFRGWPAGIAMQFKKYQQGMYYLWGKNVKNAQRKWKDMPANTPAEIAAREQAKQDSIESKRALAGLLAMQFSVAGVFGLPLADTLVTALQSALGLVDPDDDDDKPYELEQMAREWLTENFGETFATAVTKGAVNAFTPVDTASRMDLSTVFFRKPLEELEGKDQMSSWLTALFGPTGGMMQRLWEGKNLMSDGQYGRGLEQMLPKFASDPIQALRFANEDARSLDGIKLKDMSLQEIALKAVGIGSSSLKEKYEQRGADVGDVKNLQEARSKLLKKAARAKLEGAELPLETIQEWNRKHPGKPIQAKHILASVRATNRIITKNGEKGYYTDPDWAVEEDED